jgi:hypothetical protein
MKSILLASASVFAFAGAAAAEISFTGEAELGYNDDGAQGNDGFYHDLDFTIVAEQALDNGLTAGASLDISNLSDGGSIDASDYTLYVESDMAALRFGDLDPVAEDNWGGVDGSAAENFNDQDTHFNAGFDAILVGEVSYGGIDGMISYGVDTNGGLNAGLDELDGLQLYVTGDFGNVSAEMAYQEAPVASDPEVIALGASTTFGGADVGAAFVNSSSTNAASDEQSIGVDVSYPVGPVTAGAYFTSNRDDPDAYGFSVDYSEGPVAVNAFYDNDVDDTAEDYGIEGSYDVGNGLMIMAGLVDSFDDRYIAGEYDLGNGAALLISHADDSDNDDTSDEIGDPEYQEGTTVEVSFEF